MKDFIDLTQCGKTTIDLVNYWPMIIRISDQRYNSNRQVRNRRIGGGDDWIYHVTGTKGEFAFCLFYGLPMDPIFNIMPTGGQAGLDFNINGKKIEVKGTQWPNGVLIVNPRVHIKHQAADIYVLVADSTSGSSHEVRIAGWITSEEYKANYEVKDFGFGPTPHLPQKKLNHEDSLRQILGLGKIDKSKLQPVIVKPHNLVFITNYMN